MAHSTLPVLSASDFPQVLSASIDRFIDQIVAKPQLGLCDFEDEHCDCRQPATVHVLQTDQEFCARHFAVVVKPWLDLSNLVAYNRAEASLPPRQREVLANSFIGTLAMVVPENIWTAALRNAVNTAVALRPETEASRG